MIKRYFLLGKVWNLIPLNGIKFMLEGFYPVSWPTWLEGELIRIREMSKYQCNIYWKKKFFQ